MHISLKYSNAIVISIIEFSLCTTLKQIIEAIPVNVFRHINMMVDCAHSHLVQMLGENCTHDVIKSAVLSAEGRQWVERYDSDILPVLSTGCN